MSTGRPGTLERVADLIGQALLPISDVLTKEELPNLLPELGSSISLDLSRDGGFTQKLADAGDAIRKLPQSLDALAAAVEAEDLEKILKNAAELIGEVVKIAEAFKAVAEDLERATAGRPDAGEIATFAGTLVSRLFETAIVRYLERASPVAVDALPSPHADRGAAGHLHRGRGTEDGADAEDLLRAPRAARADPLARLETGYGWGTTTFDPRKLFGALAELLIDLNVLGWIEDSPAPELPDLDPDEAGTDPPPPAPPGPLPPTLDLWVLQIAKKGGGPAGPAGSRPAGDRAHRQLDRHPPRGPVGDLARPPRAQGGAAGGPRDRAPAAGDAPGRAAHRDVQRRAVAATARRTQSLPIPRSCSSGWPAAAVSKPPR